MASIKDVAEQAGVSMSTVSHVINQTRYVSPELTVRVERAIAELNYRPSALARGLRRKETLTLGLLIPDNSNPFFSEVAKGAEDAGFNHGYSVILCNSNGDIEKELSYLETLVSKGVDGIIIMSGNLTAENVEPLKEQGIPFVIVDREIPGVEVDTLVSDDYDGGYRAASYLIELGHKKIACITGSSHIPNTNDRSRGYQAALKDAGIEPRPEYHRVGNYYSESGYARANDLMALADPPTAIFCQNDLMALGALRALHELNLVVPGDVSIIGYDDITLVSYNVPALTTVIQPKYEIGKLSVEMLLDRLANGKEQAFRRVVLETELVERETTAPAKQ